MNNALTVSPVLARYTPLARRLPKPRDTRVPFIMFAFWAAHFPVALAMRQSGTVSTAHAVVTVAVGLYFALAGRKHLRSVAYTAAYITGAEVLWRMTNAQVLWELGKWSIAALMIVAMIRSGRLKGSPLVLCYFALLLPSAMLTLIALGFSDARRDLSFNLSGPFSLAVCCFFFSNLRLSVPQLQRLFLIQVAPIIGIATLALYSISTATNLTFGKNSSFEASGGWGPNQVSAGLGLGALLALLVVLVRRVNGCARALLLLAMLFLAVHSALTFSRGGLYNAVGAALFSGVYFVRDPKTRARLLVLVPLLVLTVNYLLLPQLEAITGGALSERFKNTDTTNRHQIALAELGVWADHPLLGVGPGQSRMIAGAPAHTEMTRLVAEHGVLGLVALVLLLVEGARNLKRARTAKTKAVLAAAMSWSLVYMLNAGMRLVAPSFLFGLSFLILSDQEYPYRKRRRTRLQNRPPGQAPRPYSGLPRLSINRNREEYAAVARSRADMPTRERNNGDQPGTQ